MKKIIVTGSRTFKNKAFLEQKLDELVKDLEEFELIHGHCPLGADKLADSWTYNRFFDKPATKFVNVYRMPADWKKHGYAAGPIRNREMAQYAGKDGVCVAFWADGSRGTMNMMSEAYAVGMQVICYQNKDWENDNTSRS